MAKKEQVVDLSPKADKITEEQLTGLQSLLNEINKNQLLIGQLETQKAGIIEGIGQLQVKLREIQASLEEEYGKVSVNITDGSISELPQNEADKED
tara:strand:+ start:775 stop:1062 length:288 start_codon:yes stop_codon:yes gene_type:complete